MNRKDKIEALKRQLILHPSYLTIIEEIEKDLEVLQIIKNVFNYKTTQKFVDNMSKEDFLKVQKWFENEKDNI